MSRPLKIDWVAARAYYEAGHSMRETAAKIGVTHPAVLKHVVAEEWTHDISHSLRQATDAKVTGVVTGGNPQKTAAAIAEEAERRAAVIVEHRQEWRMVGGLRTEAIQKSRVDITSGFEAAKLAKITAECTAIKQAGERKAWGLDAEKTSADSGVTAMVVTLPVRAGSLTEWSDQVRRVDAAR